GDLDRRPVVFGSARCTRRSEFFNALQTWSWNASDRCSSAKRSPRRSGAAKKEGCDPKEWPLTPPLRGISNEAAGKIINAINAINAFIISRRFQDEVAEKRRVDDLENRLNEAL